VRDLPHAFSPPWAPHFVGRHGDIEKDPETSAPEPIHFTVECGRCGARWAGTCESGMVRQRISRLAVAHAHRNPLAPENG
jgi:hypothetical protein